MILIKQTFKMLLNGYVLSPLGCQNWALKMSLWWKLCQGQLVPAVAHFVGYIGCLAAPNTALHVNTTLHLCINHAVWLLKDPLIQVNSIFSVFVKMTLFNPQIFFFKYHFIFKWNEAVFWGSSLVVMRSLVYARPSESWLYMLPSHSQQLAPDLLLSFLHPHQPQCGLGPQVPPSQLCPSSGFGALSAFLPPLSLGSFGCIPHLGFPEFEEHGYGWLRGQLYYHPTGWDG